MVYRCGRGEVVEGQEKSNVRSLEGERETSSSSLTPSSLKTARHGHRIVVTVPSRLQALVGDVHLERADRYSSRPSSVGPRRRPSGGTSDVARFSP